MLYPREEREIGNLSFQCRNCQYVEEVGPVCIYRNELSNTVGETSGVTQDVASDPTVGDIPGFCTLCGQEILCQTCAQPLDSRTYLEVVDQSVAQPQHSEQKHEQRTGTEHDKR